MPKSSLDLPTAALHTRHGAGILADHINAYWLKRGAEAGAERYEIPNSKDWGVRSTMRGGMPVGFVGRAWRRRQ